VGGRQLKDAEPPAPAVTWKTFEKIHPCRGSKRSISIVTGPALVATCAESVTVWPDDAALGEIDRAVEVISRIRSESA